MICSECNNVFFSNFAYLSHVKNCTLNVNNIYDELKKELKIYIDKYKLMNDELLTLLKEDIPVRISQTQYVIVKKTYITYIMIVYCDTEFHENFHNRFSSQEEYDEAFLKLMQIESKRLSLSKIYSDLVLSKALPVFTRLFKNDCDDGFENLFDSLF